MRTLLVAVGISLILTVGAEVSLLGAQLNASFQVPTLGYVFDSDRRLIWPIVGIAGSSRIDAPLSLPLTIDTISFLPDQEHAIVGSRDLDSAVLVDLSQRTTTSIGGAPSSITKIETSSAGTATALFYEGDHRILIVTGLPDSPKVKATIDVAKDHLNSFSVSDDGSSALLSFSSEQGDSLYSWTPRTGLQRMPYDSRVWDAKVFGDDAVIIDRVNSQVSRIRNFTGQISFTVIADAEVGLRNPKALLISSSNQIYVGDSDGTIFLFNSVGELVQRTPCTCEITAILPLKNSAMRLTNRIDQPIFVLDSQQSGRIVFIPAVTPDSPPIP